MFRNFGATPADQDTYGDLEPLAKSLDKETAAFVRKADELCTISPSHPHMGYHYITTK
jgi:hypothetical protein